MGRRGPRPTPTPLKLLRGNPGRRPLNKREPKPPAIVPTAPAHLDPVARAEWRRVIRPLAAAGLVTQVDRAVLAGYCMAWSTAVDAAAKIQEFGRVLKSPTKGYPILNPYVPILNNALKQLRDFGSEFGMTPASRSRIETDAPPKGGELEAFRRRRPRA